MYDRLDPAPLWPSELAGAGPWEPQAPPTLTAYLPRGGQRTSACVVLPGGGYGGHAPHEGEPIARWLVGLGIAAFVATYRVAPHRHPRPLLDASRAVQLVRSKASEYRVDPGRVAMLGFSAGGHLAATVGTQRAPRVADDEAAACDARPDALILCYPVISFEEHNHPGSVANLLGDDATAAERAALSAQRNVTAATPPTFLWHTADDGVVPAAHSLLFAQALCERGVPCELHVFPHGAHGLGLAEQQGAPAQWTQLCATWLSGQGFVQTQ
jgi:acetyl esterase/lipase